MMVDFKKKILSSGLSLVMAPMETESVAVLGMVRAGSSDEIEGQYGGAHFLEHMVFKGTKKYPKVGDISKAVEGVGGLQNAFTGDEYTGFWVKAPAEGRDLAIEVVGQMMNEPLMKEVEFKKERGTIIEEIKMYGDLNHIVAAEKFDELVFKGTSRERSVLGTVGSIKKMGVGDLNSFHDRWYFGENMVVVVAGKLGNEEKLVEKIEKEFRTIIEKGKWEDKRKKEVKGVMKDVRIRVTKKESEQINLVLGVNWFSDSNKNRDAALVMSKILGGGMSSRLWVEIREKRGLAYSIGSRVWWGKDQGTVYARGGIRKGKGEEAVKIIKQEMYRLSEKMVSEKELKRAKESLKGGMKLGLEESNRVADSLGRNWVLRNGEIRGYKDREKGFDNVTREDVKRVAKDIFGKQEWCLSVVGTFDEKKKEEELNKVLKS